MMQKLTGIKAVIIDLDGTMVDTMGDFLVAINAMRDELHLAPLAYHDIHKMVGKGGENLITQVLALDLNAQQIAEQFSHAYSRYQHHYLAINGQFSALYPHVEAGLIALKQKGLRLACVTNKQLSFTLPLLKQKGLFDYFEVIYGGDSFANKKPHPEPMLQVSHYFDLAPEQIVAIGDSSNDAIAARAATVGFAQSARGYGSISAECKPIAAKTSAVY